MERRSNNSLVGRRRHEEQTIYQLQPPPIAQLLPAQQHAQNQLIYHSDPSQQQQQHQQIYVISPSQSMSQCHPAEPHRGNLNQLADKLGVKNGGHPLQTWSRPERKRTRNDNRTVATSSGDHNKKSNKQLGIKLAQRGFKFSDIQRSRLNEAFAINRYPKPDEMELLAYEINVRRDQVKNWFHDQRRKFKKEIAMNKRVSKKPIFTSQQRKKLEEFFEKNFHPYPGDSRRLVEDFEMEENTFGRPSEQASFAAHRSPEKSAQSRGFKFTEDQRSRLRSFFDRDKYPSHEDMQRLADTLCVRRQQVRNWFHDQRRKLKKESSVR